MVLVLSLVHNRFDYAAPGIFAPGHVFAVTVPLVLLKLTLVYPVAVPIPAMPMPHVHAPLAVVKATLDILILP